MGWGTNPGQVSELFAVLMIAMAPIMVVAMVRILATLLAFATPTTTAGMLRATGAVNLVVM